MKKLLLIVFVILKCYSMNGQNFNSSLFLGIDLLDPFDSLLIDTTFDVEYTLRTFPSNIVERRIQFGNNIKEYLGVPVEKLDLLVTEKEIHKVLYNIERLI